jgi:hypothetical protein
MKVIVHIGWHKTGTSAIQYLLHANRRLLRERWRLNYPEAGIYQRRAHHVAGWRLMPRLEPMTRRMGHGDAPGSEALFRAMLEETADLGCTTMLVSSETFSQVQDYEPRRLADIFKGHSLEIVGYVRRQDRYLESRYNQWVKGRRRLKIGAMQLATSFLSTNSLDYHDHFRRWAAAVGGDNVKARIYDRAALRGGDVRLDFLDTLGIPEQGLALEDEPRNVSLNFPGVQFLRRLNSVALDQAHRRRMLRALEEHARKYPDHSSLFLPEERLAIVGQFRESNRSFAREFLGRDDVFEIQPAELEAEAKLDRQYGEERFLDMLRFVLPRLFSAGGGKAKRAP